MGSSSAEGRRVAIADIDNEHVRAMLQRDLSAHPHWELWLLTADTIEGAGYERGDYLVVDPKATPRAGHIVLAFRKDGDEDVPLFRLLFRPRLVLATSHPWPNDVRVELVDDNTVRVHGVVLYRIG